MGQKRPAQTPDELWSPQPAPARAAAPPAFTLAGYDGVTLLARGGGSVVYRARQIALDKPVAVKVVHLESAEAVRHFERELEITVRLGRQHPNIVSVLDTGVTGEGDPCLVMELADLGSLEDRLRALGQLPVDEVVAAGTVVADALAFAHAQGVLHRDVKPQNILVLPTSYVLADFGIARGADAGHSASLEIFSYRHAAPQVLDGEVPVAADDIYSLGSTLYTLLAGGAPFAGATPEEDSGLAYLRRARTELPPRLARADVPEPLRDVVARCLAHERTDRYGDAGELRRALQALPTELRGWDPAARPPAAVPGAVPPAVPPAVPAAVPAAVPPAVPAAVPAAVPFEPPPLPPMPPVAQQIPSAAADPAPPSFDPGLAVSALAHLPARPHDDGLTERPPAEQPARPVPPPVRRSRAGWVVAAAAAVAALAVAGFSLLGGGHSAGPVTLGPAPATQAAPTVAVPTPAVPTPAVPTPAVPATAAAPSVTPAAGAVVPSIAVARATATGTFVRWTYPGSTGTTMFVVVQIVDGKAVALGNPTTALQLTVVPKPAARPCFAVLALTGSARAVSMQHCRA